LELTLLKKVQLFSLLMLTTAAVVSAAKDPSILRKVKQAGDLLLVSIHRGGNWGYEVPKAHKSFAHRLIDEARMDVVHGHWSHHVRPIEVHRGKLILYGCGDFINDYEGIGGRKET